MNFPVNSSLKKADIPTMMCEIHHEPDSASQIEPEMTPIRPIKPEDTVSPMIDFARAETTQAENLSDLAISPQKQD
jgi:hypothetical protein